jgi:hypothetical protein
MHSTIIMPCAGRSSRFNGGRPKYLRTHPFGNLMVMEALFGLDLTNVSDIIITVVKEHIKNVNLDKIIYNIQNKINIKTEFLILDDFTSSQSDTVYQTIKLKNIATPIFIKDCDNYFNSTIPLENSVCISSLTANTNAINKSFISLDKFGCLSGIIEKQVISDKFCVGGYSFSDPQKFVKTFEELYNMQSIQKEEIYISHIIKKMLLENETFDINQVKNYNDWGTISDWEKYISEYKTIFCDIDGCLVENSSEYFIPEWGNSKGLSKNIEIINSLFENNKTKIILTTSRKSIYKDATINQLNNLNIKYHDIIFDLPHSKRIIINDYSSETNKFPTAISINIKRDQDNLEDFLISCH